MCIRDRAQQDALWAEAQRLSDQLVAQQAANGQSTESNPGGYIWPVDSRYITSTMGGRTSVSYTHLWSVHHGASQLL